ncbi:MAG: hypothetical protein H0W74_10885 [Sphingosinicella sp.]|nr:hypothetical protein [Sphingosinicella sp.]
MQPKPRLSRRSVVRERRVEIRRLTDIARRHGLERRRQLYAAHRFVDSWYRPFEAIRLWVGATMLADGNGGTMLMNREASERGSGPARLQPETGAGTSSITRKEENRNEVGVAPSAPLESILLGDPPGRRAPPANLEIPLLRESVSYSARLARAAQSYGESRYATHRRINWSHRYADGFYSTEAALFVQDSAAYLAGDMIATPHLEDVFQKKLAIPAIAAVALKVLAHRIFAWVGMFQARLPRALRARVYRKCYVDDIELVFDPEASDTLRAVYPFPLSIRRQIRYISRLFAEGRRFRFAGHRYRSGDFVRLLRHRDVRSLMRMEARSQLAHAYEIAKSGYTTVQLSDEFSLGSLEFARALDRCGIVTVNSAHGVGKYLPVHAYRTFYTLTDLQQEYYIPVLPCRYERRQLNDLYPAASPIDPVPDLQKIQLVLLSQTFPGLTGIVRDHEDKIIRRLVAKFATDPMVELRFKPHPTQGDRPPPAGFRTLSNLSEVNGRPGTVFVSQFSTCQINPTFKGRKFLLRGDLVHPEIAFDKCERILTLEEFIGLISDLPKDRSGPYSEGFPHA